MPKATYLRWKAKFEAGGKAALVDGKSTGRKPVLVLTEDEEEALKRHRLRKRSVDLAVEEFMGDPACRAETAAVLQAIRERAAERRRRVAWPPSVKRACAASREDKDRFRGRKHAQNSEASTRRGLTYLDEEGNEMPAGPNLIWESDDMSSNEPFRFFLDGEETLGRQCLITADVFSGAYLGLSPVGRPRDAYRAEDILEHMQNLVDAWGMPAAWRIEQGVWKSQAIWGVPLDGLGCKFKGKTWGGLGEIFRLIPAFKSRHKGYIESSFNHFQDLMAHESTSLGRVRGEFEDATRWARQIAAIKDPKKREKALAKFWTIAHFSNVAAEKMERFNAAQKERRAFGKDMVSPDELREGAPRIEFPPSERWRFLPAKQIRTVVNGVVQASVPNYPRPFQFVVNGSPGMGDNVIYTGHKVLVAFHPARPEEGCHIFNGDMGSNNRRSWPFAKFIGIADALKEAPMVDLRPRGERRKDGDDYAGQIYRANMAVHREFRQIVGAGQKEKGARISEVSVDGVYARTETGTNRLKPNAPPDEMPDPISGEEPAPRASRPASNEDEDDFATVSTAPPWDEDDWAHL